VCFQTFKRVLFPSILSLVQLGLSADSYRAPALEWVKTVSGSGASSVAGVATDAHGNLYIAGSTTSLDLPIVAAAQPHPGASPVVRINASSRISEKLYAPDLASANSIAVDAAHPQTIYATSAAGLARSTDDGATWKEIPGFPAGTNLYSVAVDPTDSNILYTATSPLGVFKSTDAGATWTAINNGIPIGSTPGASIYGFAETLPSINVSQIWIDPQSPNVLFANLGPAALLRSSDAGASWAVVSLSSYQAYGIVFDPFTKGTIYTEGPDYFYKSIDEGLTWTPLAPFPDQSGPVVIAVDPFHKGTLYGGSRTGLFQSTDSGESWTLRINAGTGLLVSDPNHAVIYAYASGLGIIESTNGFQTYSTISSPPGAVLDLEVAGPFVFVLSSPTTDVFVTKLDPNGNIVYSTYFGGALSDTAVGIAIGNDGSAYVTGATNSADFPVTKGAFQTALPPPPVDSSLPGSNFILKLNPAGSLAWSTYFTAWLPNSLLPNSTVQAIAIDAGGSPYISGETTGGLPATSGVYEMNFSSGVFCGFMCQPGFSAAFLTKFNAQGSALEFSTYISLDSQRNLIESAQSIALAPNGEVYLADTLRGTVYAMNATGSALLYHNTIQPVGSINAIALDKSGNVFVTGATFGPFVTTPGAFQRSPGFDGGDNAYVVKFNPTLSGVLAATLFGGAGPDSGQSVAIDPAGNVIVGGSNREQALPLRAPFQASFAPASGFVAAFDSDLTQLLFSTYLGDTRDFTVQGAVPDNNGNVLIAGASQTASLASQNLNSTVIANKIALPPTPAVRLDSIVNYASKLAAALSPGETIAALGSGFGPDAKLLLDGVPLSAISTSPTSIVAMVPADSKTSGASGMMVSSNGVSSNIVYLPAASASPGIYSADNTGFGQGYILNADGTRNSQSNPAAQGSGVTILATGVGPFSLAGSFAVTDQTVAVFIDEHYASGIAAEIKPAPGLPGDVYAIGVYVPDLGKLTRSSNQNVTMFVGPAESQIVTLWVK
jgi:uncharacterized protein (TIGR03437 family)